MAGSYGPVVPPLCQNAINEIYRNHHENRMSQMKEEINQLMFPPSAYYYMASFVWRAIEDDDW